ncbi:centromere protein Chl4/mis15/CENP-N [Trichoderma sp. SZMC 28011]
MVRFSVPTKARLPSSLRVDSSNPAVIKSLGRLSREALISLAISWLDEDTIANAVPYLERRDEEDEIDPDDIYPPCGSVQELYELYVEMQQQKGSKRDVANRILEGDWRHGLSLYQLAMVDFYYLEEHPMSQKWTAYKILPLKPPTKDADDEILQVDDKALNVPRFHPSTFLQSLQDQVLPDVKAHYQFYRPKDLSVLLLRIFVIESPYNSSMALSGVTGSGGATNFTSSRTVYLAFPDGSSHIYITKSQANGPAPSGESKSLQNLIIHGVPKALSRPRERYTLKPTSLTSRNLETLLDKRGPGRGNAAGGGWSIYASDKNKKSPLDTILPSPPLSRDSSLSEQNRKRLKPLNSDQQSAKRAKLVAQARFGDSGLVADGKGIERVDVLLKDPFPTPSAVENQGSEEDQANAPSETSVSARRRTIDAVLRQAADGDDEEMNEPGNPSQWRPTVQITFQGNHVFAGIRQLVEAGIVDGERMPGWMTGEDGVTVGVVKHGRIRGNKGSGL